MSSAAAVAAIPSANIAPPPVLPSQPARGPAQSLAADTIRRCMFTLPVHASAVVPRQTPPELRGNQRGGQGEGAHRDHHLRHHGEGSVVNDVSTLSAPSTFVGEDGALAVWQRVPFRLELSWEFQQWMSKHGQRVCCWDFCCWL